MDLSDEILRISRKCQSKSMGLSENKPRNSWEIHGPVSSAPAILRVFGLALPKGDSGYFPSNSGAARPPNPLAKFRPRSAPEVP